MLLRLILTQEQFGDFHNICLVKISRLGTDLPTSVSDRGVLPYHQHLIFTKLHEK